MKPAKLVLAAVLIAGCGALAYSLALQAEHAVRRLTIEVLRSIPKAFLVLETQREVAVASVDGGSLLLGPRLGHATASRRTHFGLDMETVGPGDIEVSGQHVTVRIPGPAVLDSALDHATVRMFTKRSGFQLLRDLASGRSMERELLELLGKTTPEYTGEDLRAQRQSFLDRLNRSSAELFKAKGLTVEFH
jgi:hypothetical protein